MCANILKLIDQEKTRQQETLMMIPSENYTYPEVRRAVGSVLMHKYAEGQPGKRYYQGNQFVDQIEIEAQTQALKAFGLSSADYGVNVQAHSGSPANLAVYGALLKPGDKILSLALPSGGHLSHGWQTPKRKVSFVSQIYDVSFYELDPQSHLLDYAQIEKIAQQIKPQLIISGGTAYPRDIDYQKLSSIAKKVGALYLADIAHEAGLIIAQTLNSPFPHADVVTFTTHKTLRGPRGAVIIAKQQFIDAINTSVFPGLQGGPHLHSIAGIAIALQNSQTQEFRSYAQQTIANTQALSQALVTSGFTLITGGSDKHLLLIDLRPQNITGAQAATVMEAANIIANKNTIPFDPSSAFNPSGLRLGTQALAVRGMKESQIQEIAAWISQLLNDPNNARLQKEIKTKVQHLCDQFPVPGLT